MPQYEIETPDGEVRRLRARDPEDAAHRAGLAGDADGVEIEADADVQGWRSVSRTGGDGATAVGRVREFSRMRFRRD